MYDREKVFLRPEEIRLGLMIIVLTRLHFTFKG